MKSSNAELFAQLTEVTKDLEFPISCSSNPIQPFIWEVETQREFNIENLLKTTIPDFSEYSEGGKIMRNADLEAYWHLIFSPAQKHSPETLQKYQILIDLLQSHVTNGSPVLMGISKYYLNKQANSFSRKDSKLLKP